MPDFTGLGKMIIFMGLGIVALGIIISLLGKLPSEGNGLGWLGKLPGDFLIKRDNFTFLSVRALLSASLAVCCCTSLCDVKGNVEKSRQRRSRPFAVLTY